MLVQITRPFVFLGLVILTALPRICIFAFGVFVGFLGPILSAKCYMPYQWGDLANRMNQSGSFREIILAAVAVVAVVMCDILHSFSGGKVRGFASVGSLLMFLVLFAALLLMLPQYASLPTNRALGDQDFTDTWNLIVSVLAISSIVAAWLAVLESATHVAMSSHATGRPDQAAP